MKHYLTKYVENGTQYAESWLQLNLFGMAFCFWRKRIEIGERKGRYIDADKLIEKANQDGAYGYVSAQEIDDEPTADVRKNVHAKKVIGGGEHDGSTCWLECSHCHGTVDLQDMFCKHCGAVLEYEK